MNVMFRALVVLIALSPLACSATDAPQFKLGEHYVRVRAVHPPANPAKIEVAEVFAYSCPHCFQFEPVLRKWLKSLPADAEFVQMPHTLGNPAGAVRNKAFHAAKMLGVLDKFHEALFGAIHVDSKPMTTPEELRELFVKRTGVKAEDFDGAFSSFAVDAGFRRGESTIQDMGVASVPAMVVDGQYLVSPKGGGFPRMLAVTDFLIEQARRERAKR